LVSVIPAATFNPVVPSLRVLSARAGGILRIFALSGRLGKTDVVTENEVTVIRAVEGSTDA
jgi:hypothetical protein